MRYLILSLLAVLAAPAWAADDGDFWYLQTSVYTRHFNPDPEHNNHQDLLGLEYNRADGVLACYSNTGVPALALAAREHSRAASVEHRHRVSTATVSNTRTARIRLMVTTNRVVGPSSGQVTRRTAPSPSSWRTGRRRQKVMTSSRQSTSIRPWWAWAMASITSARRP